MRVTLYLWPYMKLIFITKKTNLLLNTVSFRRALQLETKRSDRFLELGCRVKSIERSKPRLYEDHFEPDQWLERRSKLPLLWKEHLQWEDKKKGLSGELFDVWLLMM